MSDIFNGLFGGSNQQSSSQQTTQSQSNNQAYPMLSQALGGQVSNATGASNGIAAMLGLGGDQEAQNQAFQNFRNSTGYQFGLDQGTHAITSNAAAKGLLNSGATAKALNTYGQNYANTQYQNYLNPLQNLINSGNQAGGVIANAGQQSSSSGQSTSTGSEFNGGKSGAAGPLGSILGDAASIFLK